MFCFQPEGKFTYCYGICNSKHSNSGIVRMKIFTVTSFWSKDNYGQLLQAYALRQFLENAGHNAFLLRYYPTGKKYSLHVCLKTLLTRNGLLHFCKTRFKSYLDRLMHKKHPRHFEKFCKDHIKFSEQAYYSAESLQANPPEADAYVCGSDVIWGQGYVCDPIFFLGFGPEHVRRIAYAPSFGDIRITEELKQSVMPLLAKFNFISVREDSGVAICRECGRSDACSLIDPTLLFTGNDYRKLKEKPEGGIPEHFLFLYLLGSDTDVRFRDYESFARKNNLSVIYVSAQGRFDRKRKVYPTVAEWLWYLDHADYVITNSFHGMVFSLLFEKNFALLPLLGSHAKKNVRGMSLLKQLDLEDRMTSSPIPVLLGKPIHYAGVFREIEALRSHASTFLLSSLA